MIDYLRTICPLAQIDVVCSPSNKVILEGVAGVRRIVVFSKTIKSYLTTWRALRTMEYDVCFGLVTNKTTLLGWLANTLGNSAITVCFEHSGRRDLYSVFFNKMIAVKRGVEVMVRMQIALAATTFGEKPDYDSYPLRLELNHVNIEWAKSLFATWISPVIAVNLSAGNWYRMWSEEHYRECLRLLHSTFPQCTFLVFGYADRVAMAQRLAADTPNTVALQSEPLLRIASVLRLCSLVITPDTSIVHIASAVGAPIVGMYTRKATFIQEWMPYGVPFRAVITDHREPLDSLRPELVVKSVQELFDTVIMLQQARLR